MGTDEIVRGLRKCADGESCVNGLCSGCPANNVRIDGACDDGIMRVAADLIESMQSKLADARNELCHAEGGNP